MQHANPFYDNSCAVNSANVGPRLRYNTLHLDRLLQRIQAGNPNPDGLAISRY